MKYQSLHGHSILSDGVMTHEQILDECQKNNIGVVAVTDHDTLIKPEIFERIKNLNHRVKFVSGIELTADFVPETKIKIPAFHIVGLFVDPTNRPLLSHCEKLKKVRFDKVSKYVASFSELGFSITENEILAEVADGGTVGRPHVVAALNKKQSNRDLIEKFLEDFKNKANTDNKLMVMVKEYENIPQERKDKARWFTLFLTPESPFSVYIHDPDDSLISIDQTVSFIRGAGGVALVAHWSFYDKKAFPLDLVEKLVQEKRIDGIETVYVFGEDLFLTPFSKDRQDLVLLSEKYNSIQGGGVDFHTVAHLQAMSNPKYITDAKKTEKMVEKILEKRPDLDTTWTTL